jgi:hypothetical protein
MIAVLSDRAARPTRIVMVTRGDERRAWRIIDAFVERTGLEARRSERVAEFALRAGDRDIPVVAILDDIDRDWRHHLDLGPPEHVWGITGGQRVVGSRSGGPGSEGNLSAGERFTRWAPGSRPPTTSLEGAR